MKEKYLPETHFKYGHPVRGSRWISASRPDEIITVVRSITKAVEYHKSRYEGTDIADVAWFIGVFEPETLISLEDQRKLDDPRWRASALRYLGISNG